MYVRVVSCSAAQKRRPGTKRRYTVEKLGFSFIVCFRDTRGLHAGVSPPPLPTPSQLSTYSNKRTEEAQSKPGWISNPYLYRCIQSKPNRTTRGGLALTLTKFDTLLKTYFCLCIFHGRRWSCALSRRTHLVSSKVCPTARLVRYHASMNTTRA